MLENNVLRIFSRCKVIDGRELYWSLKCCDLMITIFSASLLSYRRATICNPFPTHIFEKGKNEPNFEEAVSSNVCIIVLYIIF